MNKRKGLGRGLEALLGATAVDAPTGHETQLPSVLPLDQLVPGKYQPRTRMDEEALNELAESIRTQGLMQPILVRPLTAGGYEIIAGERRSRAARIAGLTDVPVLVRDVPDENAAVMALIENIQREDLNALEEAQGVQRLIDEFNMTHELAAKAIGRSRSATSNLLRLLQLAKPVQTLLLAGDLEMGHARALLATDGATQVTLAHQVVAKRLSVRETETLVAKLGREFTLAPSAKLNTKSRDLTRLEEELSDAVASKVVIKPRGKTGGQVIIDFASYDQLDGLMARMKGSAAS
jgi:ParB family transcriptional regulator, chromosome partitioning protein